MRSFFLISICIIFNNFSLASLNQKTVPCVPDTPQELMEHFLLLTEKRKEEELRLLRTIQQQAAKPKFVARSGISVPIPEKDRWRHSIPNQPYSNRAVGLLVQEGYPLHVVPLAFQLVQDSKKSMPQPFAFNKSRAPGN